MTKISIFIRPIEIEIEIDLLDSFIKFTTK